MRAQSAVAVLGLVIAACSAKPPAADEGRAASQPAQGLVNPEVVFFVPGLPSRSVPRDRPVTVWSFNDDTDSIFVVVRGVSKDSVASVSVEINAKRSSWEAEVTSSRPPPVDTVGRWLPLVQARELASRPLRSEFGGVVLLVLRPSQFPDSLRGRIREHSVLSAARVTLRLQGGRVLEGTIGLLPPD